MSLKSTCKEVTRLLSERQERELSAGELVVLKLHLGICQACTQVENQFSFMRRAIGRWRSDGDDELPRS